MKTFLKWWYITCTTVIGTAVLTMAACVCTHVRTHDDRLLLIANYTRYAIFCALAAAILPLPVIWVIRMFTADNPPISSIGAHLPHPTPKEKKK